MRKKKVFTSAEIKGVYVLKPAEIQHFLGKNMRDNTYTQNEIIEEEKKLKELELAKEKALEEGKAKELELAKEEAYKKGKLEAEKQFSRELNRVKSVFTALQGMVKSLKDERKTLWEKYEFEIVNLILAIAKKVVASEIRENAKEIVVNIVKDTLTYASENKVIAIRLSPENLKQLNVFEEIKGLDKDIKILEDNTIKPCGCIIETDFGAMESLIDTRWDEIVKSVTK
ncbi:MAG: hypothetical protein MRJ65_12635 [Candidatus Brocadiaceae bacterium]|nr:hypothetical protein [Candidatus Brocadiaceae bacterium]